MNVQYILKIATTLINEAVKQQILQAISTLSSNKNDPAALYSILASKEDPFVLVRNQRIQIKCFATHFGNTHYSLQYSLCLTLYKLLGMIEPVNINLPVGPADFGRHRTGKDPFSIPLVKNYVYVPLLRQLERILNFPYAGKEVFTRKRKTIGILNNMKVDWLLKKTHFFC